MMQEETSCTSLGSEIADEVFHDFSIKMKMNELDTDHVSEPEPSDEEVGVVDDDEDFSFVYIGSPITADDEFDDGQIRHVFPLFDQSLLFAADSAPSKDDLRSRPPVKKVFVEEEDSNPPATEEVTGPYCEWSRRIVEASPEACKKSNSTGFSKFWRIRDLQNRSNSDGRDAFVFLNNGSATSSKRVEKVEERKGYSPATSKIAREGKAVNVAGEKVKAKAKAKAKAKSETASAHELHYVKNRTSREEDRRRSYLPYRPELVGFFTNVHGGVRRNVHPF